MSFFFFLFLAVVMIGGVGAAWVFAPAMRKNAKSRNDALKVLVKPSVNLTVVVPAYNEADRLPGMLDGSIAFFDSKKKVDKTVRGGGRLVV